MLTIKSLYNVKSGARGGDDVTVGLVLPELHCLLFLQHEKAVELSSCLFLVVASAQIQQADRFCSGLSNDSLWKVRSSRRYLWIENHFMVELNMPWQISFIKIWSVFKPVNRAASAASSCSTFSPPDPGLRFDLPPPFKHKFRMNWVARSDGNQVQPVLRWSHASYDKL